MECGYLGICFSYYHPFLGGIPYFSKGTHALFSYVFGRLVRGLPSTHGPSSNVLFQVSIYLHFSGTERVPNQRPSSNGTNLANSSGYQSRMRQSYYYLLSNEVLRPITENQEQSCQLSIH